MTKTKTLATMAASALVAITVPISLVFGLEGEELEETHREPDWPIEWIPQLASANSIRDQYKETDCLKDHYTEEVVWDTSLLEDKEFGGVGSFSSSATKSCLLIEYNKQKYENGKWLGEFRLIWSVKNETSKQGLIFVTNARTQYGQLWGNSEAYTIRKFNNKWFVLYLTESKKTERTLKKLISKTSFKLSELSKERFWGFNPTLHNICGRGDCTSSQGKEIKKSHYWEFEGNKDGNETVYSWTSDINLWLKDIFDWEKFVNKIQNVKGKWVQKRVSPGTGEEMINLIS